MTVSGKILVTPRSATANGHASLDRLAQAGFEVVCATPGKQPDEAELLRRLPDCVGYLAGVEPIGPNVLQAAAKLKVISRNGTGVDNVDLAAAKRLGIAVLRAEGANARGVAELTIALILTLARWIPPSDAGIKAGGWTRHKGIELEGRTLGLVGCGRIGRMVAEMAIGLGMEVAAFDVFRDEQYRPSPRFRFATLDDVLHEADVVSLHCPARDGGQPLIDAAVLARMRRGTLLVNTARASLLDRAAVVAALDSGQLGGVALDVFEQEPPGDDPLALHQRAVATPHIGGFTGESVDRAMHLAVDNLLRFFGDES